MTALEDLSIETKRYYTHLKTLPDGRIVGVKRLLYHWTVHIDISDCGYSDRYCYPTQRAARVSLKFWDGEDDPPGNWHKHPTSGRRRSLKTGEIWFEP